MKTPGRYRQATIGGCLDAEVELREDGVTVIRSREALQDYPQRLCDRLAHWAEQTPEQVFVARRGADGEWIKQTFAETVSIVRSLGQALLEQNVSTERPVAILSGNSIEHLNIALACAWIGVPHAPVSPAYSLISNDFSKLEYVVGQITPGLIFVDNADVFATAIAAAVPKETPVLSVTGIVPGRKTEHYSDWLQASAGVQVDKAFEQVDGDTILKFLFTSGSTKMPKAVITTNRMICANQQMLSQSLVFLTEEPPLLVDWLPWNHVFGGSHNVGIALYNGGSLYIDDGKPTQALIGETLRNLRELSPTVYFNVPKGFEEIARAMTQDKVLRESLLKRVKCYFYAGAGLSQTVQDMLESTAESAIGERISVVTGLGMTETAPSSTFAVKPGLPAGSIGLPCPGVEAKLVPMGDKQEIRFRGPNVMPGYWRAPELTAEAFDQEGFYRTGDGAVWLDPDDVSLGLLFDGRIAEDFKLSSGTFVSVGPLRTRAVLAGSPYVQDVVVTGLNHDDVGLFVFARLDECAALAGMGAEDPAAVYASAPVRAWLQTLVDSLWEQGSGSATRVARAMLMTTPPTIDNGEVTDKGSINQRAVLKARAALVETLHGALEGSAEVVLASRKQAAPR
ncbi:MAG: feruloyl-CoA synthase [Burkholderiaceae bacterium]